MFPKNPKQALIEGFKTAEREFLELAENQKDGQVDKSGSCALVVLIVGKTQFLLSSKFFEKMTCVMWPMLEIAEE